MESVFLSVVVSIWTSSVCKRLLTPGYIERCGKYTCCEVLWLRSGLALGTTELRLLLRLLLRGMDTTPPVPLLFPRNFSRALRVANSEFKKTGMGVSGAGRRKMMHLRFGRMKYTEIKTKLSGIVAYLDYSTPVSKHSYDHWDDTHCDQHNESTQAARHCQPDSACLIVSRHHLVKAPVLMLYTINKRTIESVLEIWCQCLCSTTQSSAYRLNPVRRCNNKMHSEVAMMTSATTPEPKAMYSKN